MNNYRSCVHISIHNSAISRMKIKSKNEEWIERFIRGMLKMHKIDHITYSLTTLLKRVSLIGLLATLWSVNERVLCNFVGTSVFTIAQSSFLYPFTRFEIVLQNVLERKTWQYHKYSYEIRSSACFNLSHSTDPSILQFVHSPRIFAVSHAKTKWFIFIIFFLGLWLVVYCKAV